MIIDTLVIAIVSWTVIYTLYLFSLYMYGTTTYEYIVVALEHYVRFGAVFSDYDQTQPTTYESLDIEDLQRDLQYDTKYQTIVNCLQQINMIKYALKNAFFITLTIFCSINIMMAIWFYMYEHIPMWLQILTSIITAYTIVACVNACKTNNHVKYLKQTVDNIMFEIDRNKQKEEHNEQ